jgi:hypothetical protein
LRPGRRCPTSPAVRLLKNVPGCALSVLAPRSVNAVTGALRQLARWILASANIESVTETRRDDIEDSKVWLSGQQGTNGGPSANTYAESDMCRPWRS